MTARPGKVKQQAEQQAEPRAEQIVPQASISAVSLTPASLTPLLDTIDSPDDLKKLGRDQLPALAQELRDEIGRAHV